MVEQFYHAGELAVQSKAGVSEQSEHATALIHESIPSIAREFLKDQRMAILSTLDSSGCVWASALTGSRGFIQAVDSRTVRIRATAVPGDGLAERLSHTPKIGVFVIELSTRRRMKVKGQLEFAKDGALVIHVERVYSQCRKYIQIRKLIEESLSRSMTVESCAPNHSRSASRSELPKRTLFLLRVFILRSAPMPLIAAATLDLSRWWTRILWSSRTTGGTRCSIHSVTLRRTRMQDFSL